MATQESEVRKLISEIIEIPENKITMDANFFTDLGVDSLKAIEIVAAFEKKYRLVISEQDIPKITTLRSIIDYTNNLKK